MADENALDILIRLGFVGADKAEAAKRALAEVKVGATDAAPALAGLGKETEAGAEHFKLFGHHAGEVKKVTRELAKEFPLAAQALRLLTSPVGGALAVGILMFVKAKEAIEEMNKASDEMIALNSKSEFRAGIEAQKKSLEDSAIALEQWLAKLREAPSEMENFAQGLALAGEMMKQSFTTKGSVMDSMFTLDKAKLKVSAEQGLMTVEEYQNRLTALTIKHNNERLKLERDQNAAERTAAVNEAGKRAGLEGPLEKSAREAQEKVDKEKAALARAEELVKNLDPDAASKKAEEEVEKANEQIFLNQRIRQHRKEQGINKTDDLDLSDAEQRSKAETARHMAEQVANLYGGAKNTIQNRGAIADDQRKADEAKKAAEENTAELKKLRVAIERMTAMDARDQGGKLARMDNETTVLSGNRRLAQAAMKSPQAMDMILQIMGEFGGSLEKLQAQLNAVSRRQ